MKVMRQNQIIQIRMRVFDHVLSEYHRTHKNADDKTATAEAMKAVKQMKKTALVRYYEKHCKAA